MNTALPTLRVVSEPDVTPDEHIAIARLREEAFPDFAPERSYFKQLPHLRVLAANGGSIIGHAGLDHRVMAVGEVPVRVLGLIDANPDDVAGSAGFSIDWWATDLIGVFFRAALHDNLSTDKGETNHIESSWEVGAVLNGLLLFQGAVWARPTWGVYLIQTGHWDNSTAVSYKGSVAR